MLVNVGLRVRVIQGLGWLGYACSHGSDSIVMLQEFTELQWRWWVFFLSNCLRGLVGCLLRSFARSFVSACVMTLRLLIRCFDSLIGYLKYRLLSGLVFLRVELLAHPVCRLKLLSCNFCPEVFHPPTSTRKYIVLSKSNAIAISLSSDRRVSERQKSGWAFMPSPIIADPGEELASATS